MGWACFQTYGACERKAVENLRRQSFTSVTPFFKVPPSLLKPKAPREIPMFPCYGFVLLEDEQQWGCINSTPGVVRLLTNRNRDNPIPLWVMEETFINKLNAFAGFSFDEDGNKIYHDVVDKEVMELPANTIVRVKNPHSLYYDFEGTVISMDKEKRIWLLMRLFQRDVVVEFDRFSDLEVVHRPEIKEAV
jgi:transcription antitermination factor NusG